MEDQFYKSPEKIMLPASRSRLLIVDIDGVLAVERGDLPLRDRAVVAGARESISLLKQKGYAVVLCTSRFGSQRDATVEWLEKNGIPFDDIVFGKPRGILYIDDRGYRFDGWEKFFRDVDV